MKRVCQDSDTYCMLLSISVRAERVASWGGVVWDAVIVFGA